MRLAVLASGRGSNFEAILASTRVGTVAATVALVFANKPCQAIDKARAENLPSFVETGNQAKRDAAMLRLFAQYNIDVVICAGYMRIIGPPVIRAFAGRILNIHPSLLPAFRGLDAPAQALAAGAKESGCSVHLVTEEVDAGRVLAQARVPILPSDTAAVLHARIQSAEHALYPRAIAAFLQQLD